MEYLNCPNCGKMTGHKRALGWGTFFGGIITMGFSVLAIPFYPVRCIVCGRESSGQESKPQSADSYETFNAEIPRSSESKEKDTKKCPFCAEVIKLEAIKCRFCGETFDPADVDRQVANALIDSEKKRPRAIRKLRAEIDESKGIKKCPYCGAINQMDEKTCLSCSNILY